MVVKRYEWFFVKNAGKLVFLFLVSYAFLYFLSINNQWTGFGSWNLSLDFSRIDYFFALAPVCGFFFMFLLFDWIEAYFETKLTRTPWFLALILSLSLVAYYVSLFWFYCNLFSYSQATFCSPQGSTQTLAFLAQQTPNNNIVANFLSDLPIDFLGKFFGSFLRAQYFGSLLSSPYVVFILSVCFGWASRLFLGKVFE